MDGECRWVNCLLLREIPFLLSLRLWDTYLAEGARMKEFLKYVLAAFLLYWSAQLSTMDFQVHSSSICCFALAPCDCDGEPVDRVACQEAV